MKLQELLEARRNPEQNLKVKALNVLQSLQSENRASDMYVTFVDVNKLGINPSSQYRTPIGIYTYPLEYVIKAYHNIPFAADAKYIKIVKSNAKNLLRLQDVSRDDCKQYLTQARTLYPEIRGVVQKSKSTPGATLWNTLYAMATHLVTNNAWAKGNVDDVEKYSNQHYRPGIGDHNEERHPVSLKVAEMFRRMGIDAVRDDGGGIIHPNEPTQAIFFSSVAVTHLKTLPNNLLTHDVSTLKSGSYSPEDHARKITFADLQTMSLNGQLTKRLDPSVERVLFNQPVHDEEDMEYAIRYIMDWNVGRVPQLEKYFAKDAWNALRYAECIGGAFPQGERAIRSDPTMSRLYDNLLKTGHMFDKT